MPGGLKCESNTKNGTINQVHMVIVDKLETLLARFSTTVQLSFVVLIIVSALYLLWGIKILKRSALDFRCGHESITKYKF